MMKIEWQDVPDAPGKWLQKTIDERFGRTFERHEVFSFNANEVAAHVPIHGVRYLRVPVDIADHG